MTFAILVKHYGGNGHIRVKRWSLDNARKPSPNRMSSKTHTRVHCTPCLISHRAISKGGMPKYINLLHTARTACVSAGCNSNGGGAIAEVFDIRYGVWSETFELAMRFVVGLAAGNTIGLNVAEAIDGSVYKLVPNLYTTTHPEIG